MLYDFNPGLRFWYVPISQEVRSSKDLNLWRESWRNLSVLHAANCIFPWLSLRDYTTITRKKNSDYTTMKFSLEFRWFRSVFSRYACMPWMIIGWELGLTLSVVPLNFWTICLVGTVQIVEFFCLQAFGAFQIFFCSSAIVRTRCMNGTQ